MRPYDEIPPEDSPTEITFGDPREALRWRAFSMADGRDDVAIYRNGTWQCRRRRDDARQLRQRIAAKTVPVAGDWDADGIDGIGTRRQCARCWFGYGLGRRPAAELDARYRQQSYSS